ncbi:glycosyl-4,4'-diaponeurosporenoate acyltransferase [Metabacillus sp. GX 13764]|uniref:glycosyl-4,4'-diaponeurosporenoate acyltransferase CrtO family protein n=1 Tax=Metabacillus kandeliae TaxID=2900151 RepID=UPI001E43307C|nr:glycosyl-4,4'-diaponeurosporenoate acyltransferase [Metabacillus kandeliae]MCD7036119.1 glycosyl-4,4'-diaponeurosporenoate acyltransferase [Metabacillus kandeliae]
MSAALAVLWNVFALVLYQLGIAYACSRLSGASVEKPRWLYEQKPFEKSGKFYDVFAIKKWKDRLPDAGGFFKGGFSKNQLRDKDKAYLAVFILETKRGELAHWLQIPPAGLFFLWNDAAGGTVICLYALLFHLPFIAAQRYNRLRLNRLLKRMEKQQTI